MSAIYYDLQKIRAFAFDVDGVLSSSCIPLGEDGMPCRMVNIKDGFAIVQAVRKGYPIAIITGGTSDSVERRFRALGVQDIYQGAAHKLPVLKEWLQKKGLAPEEVLYMGDDIPDYTCMKYVGLGCAPSDAAMEIKSVAGYISDLPGGGGCGRDVIEQVLKANSDWMDDAESFGW